MSKKCPHCGQSLHDAAIKCSRCKKYVPNELFDRLCDEDVELIKKNDLTPFTPFHLTVLVIGLMKDSLMKDGSLKKQVQSFGGKLDGRQQFNLLVFESYCYLAAIRQSARIKRGCKNTIIATLKSKLLTGIIESSGVKVSGADYDMSPRTLRAEGEALYSKLDNIENHLGTDTPSQVRDTIALASAVLGVRHANIGIGFPLYTQLMTWLIHFHEAFEEIFLVEEEDSHWPVTVWRAIAGKPAPLTWTDNVSKFWRGKSKLWRV